MTPHRDARRYPPTFRRRSHTSNLACKAQRSPMAEPIKVLIVDDSRLFRSALEQALGGQNDIKVVGSVFSGAKALEFISQSPPDVVTLDVEMPGMNGLATLQEIQQLI